MEQENKNLNKNLMETNADILRQEIISSQQGRMEFLKYKLLSIAVLGAVGLGLEDKSNTLHENIDYVLCLIPLVCVYVDILCYHNTIRIFVIAKFLRKNNYKYEQFVYDLRECTESNDKKEKGKCKGIFNMEDVVLYWTSLFVSALVIVYGIILLFYCPKANNHVCFNFSNPKVFLFIIFGVIGIVLTILAKKSSNKRVDLVLNSNV